ncbi:MAG TPA: hypothetical protein IAB21_03310 [Candidatus Avelusimicrobium excrementipullorum]|nr:hypothetical protein [Candidatus Avelusimicrobium excrementipullorum]
MASKEDIQNRALLLIGTEEISDFTNDSDRKIATLNHFYEEVKNKLLTLRSWTFALKRVKLEADKDENGAPLENGEDYFKYAFEVPCDMVKLLSVSRFGGRDLFYAGYELRGNKLYADAPVLYVKYTANPEDGCLPPAFADLLANALAAEVCFKLTGDKTKEQALYAKVWGQPSDNLKGGLFGFYAKADAGQNPARALQSQPMAAARWTKVGK